MPRFVVFSDIHANAYALEIAKKHYWKQDSPDGYWFLGDVVGYACCPKRTLELTEELLGNLSKTREGITEKKSVWLSGNHEFGMAEKGDLYTPSADARATWQRHRQLLGETITTQLYDNLAAAVLAPEYPNILLSHGIYNSSSKSEDVVKHCYTELFHNMSLEQPYGWETNLYRPNHSHFIEHANNAPIINFAGHIHMPIYAKREIEKTLSRVPCPASWKADQFISGEPIKLEKGYLHYVNVGSLGMPRTLNSPTPKYVLLDIHNDGTAQITLKELTTEHYTTKPIRNRLRFKGYPDTIWMTREEREQRVNNKKDAIPHPRLLPIDGEKDAFADTSLECEN